MEMGKMIKILYKTIVISFVGLLGVIDHTYAQPLRSNKANQESIKKDTDRNRKNGDKSSHSFTITLPTERALPENTLEFRIAHRFIQTIREATFNDLYGLDNFARINFGISYGLLPGLTLSLSRSNTLDNYELSGKIPLVNQNSKIPFSISMRLGTNIATEINVDKYNAVFLQLIITHKLWGRMTITSIPSYVSQTRLRKNVINLPFSFSFKINNSYYLLSEFIPKLKEVPGGRAFLSFGIGKLIGGKHRFHIFKILISNSGATTVNHYLAGDFIGGVNKDFSIGFNIIRSF